MSITTLLSLEQFFNLPELDAGKRELIEGELVELPPSKAIHNKIAKRILLALTNYLARHGQPPDRACMEAGFEINTQRRSWLQPDVAVLHADHPINRAGYYEGAPLIATEVLSPSNTAGDIERKRQIYLDNGSKEVWVVHPDTRTVTIQRGVAGGPVRHEKAIVSALLPGFQLDLDEVG